MQQAPTRQDGVPGGGGRRARPHRRFVAAALVGLCVVGVGVVVANAAWVPSVFRSPAGQVAESGPRTVSQGAPLPRWWDAALTPEVRQQPGIAQVNAVRSMYNQTLINATTQMPTSMPPRRYSTVYLTKPCAGPPPPLASNVTLYFESHFASRDVYGNAVGACGVRVQYGVKRLPQPVRSRTDTVTAMQEAAAATADWVWYTHMGRSFEHERQQHQVCSSVANLDEVGEKDLLISWWSNTRDKSIPMMNGVWLTPRGVSLTFNPHVDHIPPSWSVVNPGHMEAWLLYSAVEAGLFVMPDEEYCSISDAEARAAIVAEIDDTPGIPSARKLILKNGRVHASGGLILVDNRRKLRDLRCDVLDIVNASGAGPLEDWPADSLRVFTPSKKSDVIHLPSKKTDVIQPQFWIIQEFLTNLLQFPWPSLRQGKLLNIERAFYVRMFVAVVSVHPVVVTLHPGFVRCSGDPSVEFANAKTSNIDGGALIVRSSLLDPLLRERFPRHPDPWKYVQCEAERTAATTFAAVDVSDAEGALDRHWLFGMDVVVTDEGRVYIMEVNSDPDMSYKTPAQFGVLSDAIFGYGYLLTQVRDRALRGLPAWPLQMPGEWRPALIGNSTALPALPSCLSAEGATPLRRSGPHSGSAP